MTAGEYAAIVAGLLPPSPQVQALTQAATELDAAIAGNPARRSTPRSRPTR